MSTFPPLWAADWQDLIPFLVVIVIFIVSAIQKLLAKVGEAQQRPGGPRRPPGQGGPPQPAPNAEDEIADFLRRAIGKRGDQPPAKPQKAPAPTRPARPQPARPQPAVAEAVRQPAGGLASRHVETRVDTTEFGQRTAQLGDEVAHTDNQVEERLHEKFDHELGQFAGTVSKPAAPEGSAAGLPATAAAGLPVLLSNAENIRQAIIINEILTRPEQRWS